MRISGYFSLKAACKCAAFIFSLTALFACEKELDFKYHEVPSPLVIEGTLTEEGSSVRITYATPMDEAMDPTPVTDAEVSLSDLATDEVRALPLKPDGSFGDDIPGQPGHEYRITVKTKDGQFQSVSKMKDKTEIVSMTFQWIKMPYDYVAVLQVMFKEVPDDPDNCYWVRILRNGEPYKWSVIDRRIAVSGLISCVMMTSRKDLDEEDERDALKNGDEVTALVIPIDRSMVDYLTALSNDSNGPRMWEGDYCLGYFLAAPVAKMNTTFRPEEMTEYK